MSNKIRTVFYAEEGVKTFVDSLINQENFKSESDAIGYLIALGMQRHMQIRTQAAIDAICPEKVVENA